MTASNDDLHQPIVQPLTPSIANNDFHQLKPQAVNEKLLMAKIDIRVIPVLCIAYLFAFLDRVNIANAAVYGLKSDLGLTANQYNTALVIFFVPYIISEIPSNLLMKRFKPHVWLSGIIFLFGMSTCLQGTVNNFSGLLAARSFIGLYEAGILPGCMYLISMWYKRDEVQKRFSFFFSASSLAGAFGGLLAAAMSHMDGIGGYQAWRWIFILEGLLTCVAAVVLYFCISDFPEDAKWLNPIETAFVKHRLSQDVGASDHAMKYTYKDVLGVFKDWKIINAGFMYMGVVVSGCNYALFSPTIIQSLGYSPVKTQLYSVAPWVCGFFFSMLVAWLSDRLKHRYGFVMLAICLALAGFITLLIVHDKPNVQYAALFVAAAGNTSAMPVILCWSSTNFSGHLRRSVGPAVQISLASVGGIISAFSFLAKDAPRYIPGYCICIGFLCLSGLTSTIYFVGLVVENRKRERGVVGCVELVKDEKLGGDLSPDYRYML